jgi:hypothetical protein
MLTLCIPAAEVVSDKKDYPTLNGLTVPSLLRATPSDLDPGLLSSSIRIAILSVPLC